MPRIGRVVIPGVAHHVVQRGVRRMRTFFSDADRCLYLRLLREQARRHGVEIAAWSLMPNHVHLIAIPETQTSLAAAIGGAHCRYTRAINAREGWRGYLFQGRFFSCPLEGGHVLAAVRYVLRNPVHAGLVAHPWDYAWSSARWTVGEAHEDPLVDALPLFEEVSDWRALLSEDPPSVDTLRRHTRTGRPLGSAEFLEHAEALAGRPLRPRCPGRR